MSDYLNNLPETWKVCRVKDLFYISKELSKKDNPVVLSLARSGIKIRDISNNEGQLAASYDNYNSVKVGDLLLNPMDLYSGANCNVSEVEGVISPAYINLRAKTKLVTKFYDYYFKVQYWTMNLFSYGKGVSYDNRWTLNSNTLLNYNVPVLPYNEENKINNFLDKKIKIINNLIYNQEKQIEKLREYRQAFIEESIFNSKEFEIPLKYKCRFNVDSLREDNNPNEIINYVEIGSVSLEDGIKKIQSFLFKDAPSRARRKTKEGDIIISTVRTYLKAIAVIEKDNLIVSTGFAVLEPINVSSSYLGYVLKSNYFTNNVSKFSNGINYPSITTEDLGRIYIPMCKLSKQNEIILSIEKFFNKIDELIKNKNNIIEKMEAYQKSLIYEYICGKRALND